MSGMTRRQFGQHTLDSLLTFTLLETLISGNLLADEVKPVAAKWLADVDQLGAISKEARSNKSSGTPRWKNCWRRSI